MSFEPAHRHIRTQHTRNTWCNLPCPSDSYSIFTSRVVLRLLMSTLTYILPTPNVTYSQVWQGKGAGASFYRRHWCGFQYNSDHWPRRAGCRTSLNVVTFFLLLFFFIFFWTHPVSRRGWCSRVPKTSRKRIIGYADLQPWNYGCFRYQHKIIHHLW